MILAEAAGLAGAVGLLSEPTALEELEPGWAEGWPTPEHPPLAIAPTNTAASMAVPRLVSILGFIPLNPQLPPTGGAPTWEVAHQRPARPVQHHTPVSGYETTSRRVDGPFAVPVGQRIVVAVCWYVLICVPGSR